VYSTRIVEPGTPPGVHAQALPCAMPCCGGPAQGEALGRRHRFDPAALKARLNVVLSIQSYLAGRAFSARITVLGVNPGRCLGCDRSRLRRYRATCRQESMLLRNRRQASMYHEDAVKKFMLTVASSEGGNRA
jgi:hypothetical protein